jgi:hypothetical protein
MHGANAAENLVSARVGLPACLHEVVLCVGALPGAGSSFHPEGALATSPGQKSLSANGNVSYPRMAGARARKTERVP